MRSAILGAALAATLSAAYAETPCTTIADNSRSIRLREIQSEDIILTGTDAKDFYTAMTGLIGPLPWRPADLSAVSAHLYLGANRQKVASVHLYGGAGRCDVGFDADISDALLNMIMSKVGGVRI
jgi:hypothetical protein